jgi:transcriptional regulatory protein LevR
LARLYHKLDDNLLLWYFTENYIFQKEKKYDVVLARNVENCLRKHLHSMIDRK